MLFHHPCARAALVVTLAAVVGPAHAVGDRTTLHLDTFAGAMRYERRPAHAWLAGGAFRTGAEEALLLPPIAALGDVAVSADLRVTKRVTDGWAYAGVAIRADSANAWQLLLVEGPDRRRYFEIIETHNGMRHAQSAPGSTTRLAERASGALQTWELGARYRLTLSLSPTGVVGVVSADGGSEWRKEYDFGQRRAVREGRPALVASGTEGAALRFAVEAAPQQAGPAIALRNGRLGTVAILKPMHGAALPTLAAALASAGFGVTQVGWDDLAAKRLPDSKLDLLVLSDARALPVQARDQVDRLLCSGGRVIAIGAPAGSRLFARTPDGWVDQVGWMEATARRIERTPLPIADGAWARTAYRETQRASITRDPTQGADCWKMTTDLAGWDGWLAHAPGAFGDDRSLMVIEAKGDAQTTHLAVECVEKDSSRWFGVIPLTTEWKTHILRPEDFAYWLDSSATGRGGAGDRFRPGNVARISFTLSASHTPKVKPGPHTYWIRGLSTAGETGERPPSFALTDVEALWPSYKLYPMNEIATLRAAGEQGIVPGGFRAQWTKPGYSPVWRERGRGFGRGRAWRWVPILEAFDRAGRKRGALLSLTIGDGSSPNAMWANLAVADPKDAAKTPLLTSLVATAKAMVRGTCLLEGGAEQFAYKPGEPVRLGARALNSGRKANTVEVGIQVTDAAGRKVFEGRKSLKVSPGSAALAEWTWRPPKADRRGHTVSATLHVARRPADRIAHRIETLRTEAAQPDEFVRVKGSEFTLAGKPWHFKGINYWPTWMAGYPSLNQRTRECYDPEIIERDLAWLRKAGVNALSAIQAIMPPDPNDPRGYRDQLDFLDRCLRHGIRCYVTLHAGRAYAGADFAKLKEYIEKAGLRNHPAIMCWELAWEPIDGPWGGRLDYMRDDWNRWVVEQYGTIENAVRDWAFDPRPTPSDPAPVPTSSQCTTDGPWNRYVSAFARAHSDLIGRAYGEVVRPLRAWDPNHLITFRGGACGIPSGATFAHTHSVGVARHMDFLCPEGYNLQTGGWANPTPPDDIRKGGLVTHHFRHVSREKPIVWMEFGFTANGFGGAWSPERVHLKPEELKRQRDEIEWFYAMIVESGSRGAAPWWLPGGFRLGENSDFGLVEPDGSERPSARVFRAWQPRFASVIHAAPTADLPMDLDGERRRAWELYAPRYLDIVKAGGVPRLFSEGTGTDSATCPLTAVGGTPCDGSNPPRYLNAELDAVEVEVAGAWRPVRNGDVIEAPAGSAIRCRAQIGNTGEAAWLAPKTRQGDGSVFLVASGETPIRGPIEADTPYLGTVRVREFEIVPALHARTTVTFRMEAQGRTAFGERRGVTFVPR